MDFYRISTKEIESGPRKGTFALYPDFIVGRSKDLMVRGRSFYAVWDEEAGLWSTDEYDVQRLVDAALDARAEELKQSDGILYEVKHLRSYGTGGWAQFRKFLQNVSDNSTQLDEHLVFANTDVKKNDYASKRLPYPLGPGDISAWDELVGTLYSVEERAKIEWAIGAVVSGDAKKIQKFLVLYGPAGTGKSTVLNIIIKLFQGYVAMFDAKALGSNNAQFATEVFKNNPLVAVQQDGDLSRIEDNTRLNQIVAHEEMTMNEKYKPGYDAKVIAFLFMGTNQPVKITDAKSGIIRRLIDVHPTGVKIPENRYHTLMSQVDFELGAIAFHCLEVYRALGKNYYSGYRPTEMMLQTDVFFNFIEAHFDVFKAQDNTTMKQAYALYKEFCSDTGIERPMPMYKMREELRNYFDEFKDRHVEDGVTVRSYYSGFNANKFKQPKDEPNTYSLVMDETVSLFDEMAASWRATYSRTLPNGDEIPDKYWDDKPRHVKGKLITPKPSQVSTTLLADLDTSKLHYVMVPTNHIVIDFDLKGEDGEKSLERNLEAASIWPATYAERSKGGKGVHLHYIYDGDVTELNNTYSEGIEIKTLLGNSSLRRRLSKCNNIPVATISSGLPIKEKQVLHAQNIQSEKGLRDLIIRNMKKDIHPHTKPSVQFIGQILRETYDSGMPYDVSDMRSNLLAFAGSSSNNALELLQLVQTMPLASAENGAVKDTYGEDPISPKEQMERKLFDLGNQDNPLVKKNENAIVFFDIEVYPNLFMIRWKYQGSDTIVTMINPSARDVEGLFKFRLVGYNVRRYDNHILYAAYMGYDNEALYKLSQKMINERTGFFGEAYNLSYADIYEFASIKQSLKKWQVDLGLKHMELDLPWDKPVEDSMIPKIEEYCGNDVMATEVVFENRKQDFVARQILADLSGLAVNDTTQKHTAKIIFGNDKNPQSSFKYTDLSEMFPGYKFELGKSTYRDEDPSEGGYVYEEEGYYENVIVLDVASMHPTSIIELDAFGQYTPRFKDLVDARVAIKRKEYDRAKTMLNGALAPYLTDPKDAKLLSYALKIVINIVYGMTSAKFDNPFKDPRNHDNIVAKRGALFMIDLKHHVQNLGYQVVHIKTDSIKIVVPKNQDERIVIDNVMEYGKSYGYEFEHESTYSKFCLVNKAVYIAKYGWHADDDTEEDTRKHKAGTWEAVGAQFQHSYVFKKLFSGEDVVLEDLCETKQIQKGAMYLDFDSFDKPMALTDGKMHFIGRIGSFIPVPEGQGGGVLYRLVDGKFYAVGGTKGYLWKEAEMALDSGDDFDVDMNYFEELAEKAIKAVEKYVPYEEFVS